MREAEIQRDIHIKASSLGCRLFRNNVAKSWVGKTIGPFNSFKTFPLAPGDIIIRNPRRFHAGLCKGSSDLIGWTPITITEDMVGKQVAVFTAIEVKAKTGRATKEQRIFLETIDSSGGLSVLLKSAKSLQSTIENFICKLKS